MEWTETQIETLRTMWCAGASSAAIAAALGITRNATMGKVSRLGLKREGAGAETLAKAVAERARAAQVRRLKSRQATTKMTAAAPIAEKSAAVPPIAAIIDAPMAIIAKPIAPAVALSAQAPHRQAVASQATVAVGVALMALRQGDCRWPTREGLFCGSPAVPDRSYCCEHHAISVVASKPRQGLWPIRRSRS